VPFRREVHAAVGPEGISGEMDVPVHVVKLGLTATELKAAMTVHQDAQI